MSNDPIFDIPSNNNQPPVTQAAIVPHIQLAPITTTPVTPAVTMIQAPPPVTQAGLAPPPLANDLQATEKKINEASNLPDKTPLPSYLQSIAQSIAPAVQRSSQPSLVQPADNKSQYLLEQLVFIQRENQILLKNIMTSAALSAKIAKLKHRWQVAKFWTNILFWIGIIALSFWGAIIGYHFTMNLLNNIMGPLNQVSQSASALQNINGSMPGFDLGSLLQPKSTNETDTKKKYTSTTEPDSTFTTPAFIDKIKNLNLSNIDSESLLKKLNITPYKSNPIETLE